MSHSCVRVAAIVVSEINDRLSPKKAPPTTTATINATSNPVCCAIPAATGTSATIVPTDVPIASEIKQAAIKIPGSKRLSGRIRRVRLTVASMAPISLAEAANAPASTKIQIINMIFLCAAPAENRSTRSDSFMPRVISTA